MGAQNRTLSDDAARERLFTPEKLVLSDGEHSHWLISRQISLFKQISDEAKEYLKSIVGGDLARSASSDNWGDVSSRRGFILEFGYEIRPELLSWFTGAAKVSGDAPAVFKMMIKPDSVDESLSEIYLLDGAGNLYKYSVSNVSRPQSMQDLLDGYKRDGSPYRNYDSMRDNNLDKSFGYYQFEPDVLYVAKSPDQWQYNQIQAEVPAEVANRASDLENVVLGNEKDRFNISRGGDYLQFNNKENIYKIYDDGNLSYNYLPDTNSSDKGNVGDALIKAYSFIDRLNMLTNQKAEIYLSGVDYTKQGHYSFSFNYRFNEMPVVVELQPKDNNGAPVTNAIRIDANGRRVLGCSWVLREFNQGKKQYYYDRFMDYNGFDYKEMKVTGITAGYFLNSAGSAVMDPSLIIRLSDEAAPRVFGMPAGKGD